MTPITLRCTECGRTLVRPQDKDDICIYCYLGEKKEDYIEPREPDERDE